MLRLWYSQTTTWSLSTVDGEVVSERELIIVLLFGSENVFLCYSFRGKKVVVSWSSEFPTSVIRVFWSGIPSRAQKTSGSIPHFVPDEFLETSLFDPDKNISRSNIKTFLEMMRSLQILIQDSHISLIRRNIFGFRITEVGYIQTVVIEPLTISYILKSLTYRKRDRP